MYSILLASFSFRLNFFDNACEIFSILISWKCAQEVDGVVHDCPQVLRLERLVHVERPESVESGVEVKAGAGLEPLAPEFVAHHHRVFAPAFETFVRVLL